MILASEAEARSWFCGLPEWDDRAADRLEAFTVLLAAENALQNLVAKTSLPAVWVRHYADSAQLLALVPRETNSSWLDLGSGAGFPGLIAGILRPECEVVLVESRSRRIDWLTRVTDALELANVTIAGMKLEDLDTRAFCAISARAFAPLPRLLKLSARFSTDDTVWLLPKGRSARQELAELKGWKHMFHVEQSLTDPESGIIVGHLLNGKGGKA
jgi:16S rRNA (guanine527-N7)-methyltransferase